MVDHSRGSNGTSSLKLAVRIINHTLLIGGIMYTHTYQCGRINKLRKPIKKFAKRKNSLLFLVFQCDIWFNAVLNELEIWWTLFKSIQNHNLPKICKYKNKIPYNPLVFLIKPRNCLQFSCGFRKASSSSTSSHSVFPKMRPRCRTCQSIANSYSKQPPLSLTHLKVRQDTPYPCSHRINTMSFSPRPHSTQPFLSDWALGYNLENPIYLR